LRAHRDAARLFEADDASDARILESEHGDERVHDLRVEVRARARAQLCEHRLPDDRVRAHQRALSPVERAGPVTLRERDLARLRAGLDQRPELSAALRLRPG